MSSTKAAAADAGPAAMSAQSDISRASSRPMSGRVNRRHLVGTVLVTALLGVGVWLLIGQAANYSRLVDAVKKAELVWLVLLASRSIAARSEGAAVPISIEATGARTAAARHG